MLRDAVRGVVVVATELAEEASRRVLGAAEGLIQRTGELPPGVEQLRVLAEETVTAGRAGVDLVAGVVKNEAERVFEKVGDQVVKVGVVLSFIESKLREVDEPTVPEPEEKPEEPTVRPAARAQGLFGAGWDAEPAPADEASDGAAGQPTNTAPAATPAPRKATARKGAAAKQAAAKRSVPRKAPTEGGAAVTPKTVAKKAAAKKTAAKKTVTKKATADSPSAPLPAAANKAAVNEAAAKKAAVKKAAVKKAAPAKKTATAKKAAPGKATTAKKAPARKPAAKPEPGGTDGE
ncbi:hypothetical protein ACIHEI_30605 [Kitasatospora sp. NPDC051984]|uniref:hypothetical protein n=1 Tax=Kitasatospora sp. NPDC051984 TaxID=3364059 RepID=UPI0037CB2050